MNTSTCTSETSVVPMPIDKIDLIHMDFMLGQPMLACLCVFTCNWLYLITWYPYLSRFFFYVSSPISVSCNHQWDNIVNHGSWQTRLLYRNSLSTRSMTGFSALCHSNGTPLLPVLDLACDNYHDRLDNRTSPNFLWEPFSVSKASIQLGNTFLSDFQSVSFFFRVSFAFLGR